MFGERLRALRERRELTQSELGQVLRVSKQTITNQPQAGYVAGEADGEARCNCGFRASSSVFVGVRMRGLSDGLATVLRLQ